MKSQKFSFNKKAIQTLNCFRLKLKHTDLMYELSNLTSGSKFLGARMEVAEMRVYRWKIKNVSKIEIPINLIRIERLVLVVLVICQFTIGFCQNRNGFFFRLNFTVG